MRITHSLRLLIWGCLLWPSIAGAEVWQSKRILILSSESDQEPMKALAELLEAHLQDLDASVQLEIVAYSPRDIFEQVGAARKLVASRGAFSAIWVERSKEEIFLFVSDNSNQNVFIQTFEGSEDGWEVECEAIAVLVRSALITWLEVEPETTTAKGEVKEDAGDRAEEKSPASGSSSATPDVSVDKAAQGEDGKQRAEALSFTASVGYAPSMFSLSDSVAHRGEVALGVRLRGAILLSAAVHLGDSFPIHLTLDNEDDPEAEDTKAVDLRFIQIPTYLSAGWLFRFGIVEAGVSASFVLNITYMKSSIPPTDSGDTRWLTPGIGICGRIGIRPISKLSVFAGVGGDFYFKSYSYKWGDRTLLEFHRAQPHALVGVELILDTDR